MAYSSASATSEHLHSSASATYLITIPIWFLIARFHVHATVSNREAHKALAFILNSLGIYPPLKHSIRVAENEVNPHAQTLHCYWMHRRRQREGVFKIWFFLSAFFTYGGHQHERSE